MEQEKAKCAIYDSSTNVDLLGYDVIGEVSVSGSGCVDKRFFRPKMSIKESQEDAFINACNTASGIGGEQNCDAIFVHGCKFSFADNDYPCTLVKRDVLMNVKLLKRKAGKIH